MRMRVICAIGPAIRAHWDSLGLRSGLFRMARDLAESYRRGVAMGYDEGNDSHRRNV